MDKHIWTGFYIWIWLATLCKADIFADEIEKNLTEKNQIFQEKYIHFHKECRSKQWFCSRECRLQFFENTGSCRVPDKDETCFGVPIKHNYTWNQNVKHFPKELQILKRFPRCWASLGPLICSSIYRPCSKNAYIEYSMKKPEFVEFWQVFPSTLCKNAKKECSFVEKIGLWPEFLNCDNNVEIINGFPTHENVEQEQRLFTNQTSCKIINSPSEITFDSSQCLWPLIKGSSELEQSGKASTIMDSCYMPCETPLAGFNWMLEAFRRRNAVISFFSAVAFLLIAIYLIIFSKIYQTSLSIFCMTQGFVCMIIYLLCWNLTIFKEIRQSLLCVDNGKIRKLSKIEFLDHCALESIVTNFTLFSSISWLFIMLILRIIRPKIRNDNYFVYGSRGNEMNSRTLLVIIIYILLPIGLIFKTIFLWKNIPVDVISGICHIGAGNLEHWLIYYSTIGGFILLIVISWLIIIYKKMIQTKKLNESLKKSGQTNSQRKSLISSIEMNETETEKLKVENEKDVNSYVLENGIGDGLIPDYWLGSVFGAIVMVFLIGGFLQTTIINNNIGENYEKEMIQKSIHCSLKTLTTEFYTNWWNKTINYDHLTTIFDPYQRKEMLFDSVTAPGCELEILKETKLLTMFFTSIILPCLPYWILAVCFFAGFCNNGLKSVRKIRTKFNPFLYENVKNIDGFLQSSNDSKNIKDNIEMQSQSTAPTRATAPPIMQTESIIEENEFGLPSLNDAASTAVIGASSVHSEPVTNNFRFKSSRKIDLTKKYREYRRERLENEQLFQNAIFNGSMSSRFSDELCPSTQSEFNMTSISNNCLSRNQRMNNGITMIDLITKYEEAQKQNQQLLLENRETMDTLKQLKDSYSDVKDCIKTLASKVDNSTNSVDFKPELLLEKNNKETLELLNNIKESYSDLRETVQMLSTKLIKELSDDENSKKSRKKSVSPKGKTSEFAKKSAKQPIIEVSPLEIVAGNVSSGDEDDLPQPHVFHWSLPNPPPEVLQYRSELATGEKKIEFEYPPDSESCSSLFFRLMAHCTNGLPQWMKNPFVRACLERYEELYLENDDRSTYFSERKIYPDTEALEAATDSNLTTFVFPIICKAIADACVDLYMDSRWFFRSVSPWIPDQLDLSRFEAHITEADLQSVPEEMEVEMNDGIDVFN